MIREKLLETIDIRAEQTGLSDRALSVQATGSTDTVRNIRRGAYPRIDTVEALFEVLEMRIEITEKPISNAQYVLSGITRVGVMAMEEMQTRSGRKRLENLNQSQFNSENPALKDSRLADIISLLATEWEASDARGQTHLATRFHAYFPELGGKPTNRRCHEQR